ncbi:MAG: group 1 truncated hemoglobin [Cyclobacteriaceae bacterium]
MKSETNSLFERIGGMEAVNTAVDIFYEKVTADPLVGHFFTSINMAEQSGKLKTFLAYAFGAPLNYDGKNMAEAHKHMRISEDQFTAVAGHLSDTLRELSLDSGLIDEVMAIAASTKEDIVNT